MLSIVSVAFAILIIFKRSVILTQLYHRLRETIISLINMWDGIYLFPSRLLKSQRKSNKRIIEVRLVMHICGI